MLSSGLAYFGIAPAASLPHLEISINSCALYATYYAVDRFIDLDYIAIELILPRLAFSPMSESVTR